MSVKRLVSMSLEEASRKVFADTMTLYEHQTEKVFMAPEDREALSDMIEEWKRLGTTTLQKLDESAVEYAAVLRSLSRCPQSKGDQ